MSLAGIVAEFNPLHNGHKYLIDCAKSEGYDVAVVISGNFVQRGDVAVIPKFKRALSAVSAGADIVVEMPVPWSMSTAQNFALGGISQLFSLGIESLFFGSECGDSSLLEQIADTLLTEDFNNIVESELKSGKTFAKIRQEAVAKLLTPESASVLENPNDALAVEYILASKLMGKSISYHAVKRMGVGHNDSNFVGNFCSSSYIRKMINFNSTDELCNFMPSYSLDILNSSPISNIKRIDTAIISRIKQLSKVDIYNLPDISEGLENLIIEKAKECFTFDELCESIKSKRYTLARIRRIILCAYLGIDNSFFGKHPPYVRILAANDIGIRIIPKYADKPIITRVSQIKELDAFSNKAFEAEMRINSLYALSLDNPSDFVDEYTQPFIKI